MERAGMEFAQSGRARDHRHTLVGSGFLWAKSQEGTMNRVRCAIYTRKSSEEGLEQDFNSLDAQREACAAYVASQASEGWKLLPERYDDGGLSGGTLERPALRRLLGDVKSGRIDIIVVYKVDRLTRSLLDFAKLVEAFDAAETSLFRLRSHSTPQPAWGGLHSICCSPLPSSSARSQQSVFAIRLRLQRLRVCGWAERRLWHIGQRDAVWW